MRVLAWVMWLVAAVWLLLVSFGADNFQELYGGTSGLQFFLLVGAIAIVPLLIGWWAYRKARP